MSQTELTNSHKALLSILYMDWQEDSKEYGWTGDASGKEFLAFWINGCGPQEVIEIVGPDLEDAAWSYLSSLV